MPNYHHRLRLIPVAILISVFASNGAYAADPCSGYRIDVRQERHLFGEAPTPRTAGRSEATSPTIAPGRLYELRLAPESRVRFQVPPGKTMLTDGAYAGLARLEVGASGIYRVSLDAPFWIDVVDGEKLIPATTFQGLRTCHSPHKIVEFALRRGRAYTLQFSGVTLARLRVTVTPRPRESH